MKLYHFFLLEMPQAKNALYVQGVPKKRTFRIIILQAPSEALPFFRSAQS